MPILLAALLNFTVNYLLLLATAGLCKVTPSLGRTLLGAGLSGLHVLLCLQPGLAFLQNTLWHVLLLPVIGIVAFGRRQFRLHGTLLVLSLGLDAVVSETGVKGTLAGICAVVLLWLLLRRKDGGDKVPVRLQLADRELAITALRDTGNCLRDPISGGDVLVIGAEAARKLTGLTQEQLRSPLETICTFPGLRLIPYKAVGSAGFLLGMRLPSVKIGTWQGSHVVAFAPEGLDGNMGFEGLIGGCV